MLVPQIEKFMPQNDTEEIILNIDSIDEQEDFYNFEIFQDEKARIKYIKYIEKIVRKSVEYKRYIGFLKNELNLTKCTFLPMIDVSEIKKVGFEFHHYPFTLFDITSIVLDEHMFFKKEFRINPFDIAEEIMELHYQNYIGVVPLTKTIHELVHSGQLFVNLDYVFGNYNKFINKYQSASEDSYKELLDSLESLSKKENEQGSINGHILNRAMLRVNINDIEATKVIEIEEEKLA